MSYPDERDTLRASVYWLTGRPMKLKTTLLALALLTLLAPSVWAQDTPETGTADAQAKEESKEVGRLQNVIGTVLLKKGEQSLPVVEGQPLLADDEVLVTEGASAKVVWNDGCDLQLDEEEVYEVGRRSPCAMLWWAAPAAAGVACGAAHANKSNNSRALAAVGLAAGASLMGAAQGRETDFREYSAAIEQADGDVKANGENPDEWQSVGPGTRLRADQEVLVKAGQRALIRFDDGCTTEIKLDADAGADEERRYVIPGNSPCFTPGMWWASTAAAAGLCLSAEDEKDVSSP